MYMDPIILANWKANVSPANARAWLADFFKHIEDPKGVEVVLALPVLLLPEAKTMLGDRKNVVLAAQDISPFPPGSYTGSTPASWLADIVKYVLVGHQERRRYFHESVQDVAAKVRESVDAGLLPIVCLDESQVAGQLAAIDPNDEQKMLLAYTPQDAVSLGIPREGGSVSKVCADFSKRSGGRPVLYGGGVDKNNAAGLLSMPDVSGLMVAGASRDPKEFLAIVATAASR